MYLGLSTAQIPRKAPSGRGRALRYIPVLLGDRYATAIPYLLRASGLSSLVAFGESRNMIDWCKAKYIQWMYLRIEPRLLPRH